MKTRVAIILPYFSPGGAQVMISRLVSHLNLDEVTAEVICIYGAALNNTLEKDIMDHGVKIIYIGKEKGFSLKAVRALNQELDRFKPDVIHTHLSACLYASYWAFRHHVTMLHTVHNMPQYELIRPKRMLMRMLYRRGVAQPVAISHEIQRLMKQFYHLKNEPELIYNPVDVKKFAQVPKKPSPCFTVVSAGRISPQKNQQLLIEAFGQFAEKHPDSQLLLLGDGPDREKIEAYLAQQPFASQVFLKGNVDHIENYFAEADLFALSSVYEGLPLVVLEAMASSLPIVSTNVGGIKDIVSDNGLLTEIDGTQLSQALTTLYEDEDLRLKMGEKSYAYVQAFDSTIIAEAYVGLYKKYAAARQ